MPKERSSLMYRTAIYYVIWSASIDPEKFLLASEVSELTVKALPNFMFMLDKRVGLVCSRLAIRDPQRSLVV